MAPPFSDSEQGYVRFGVPQGAATSCGLSTMALEYILGPMGPCTSGGGDSLWVSTGYADDGLIFSQHCDPVFDPVKLIHILGMGSEVAPDKSRWLKKNGEWVVDSFRYLGIRYYPPKP